MKLQATEMHDADVSHISLVAAGANGQPIKKTKREGGRSMIDFSPGKAREERDKAEALQGVLAVIVDGAGEKEWAEKAAERIKAAGLTIEDRREVAEDKAKAIVYVQPVAKDVEIDGDDRLFYPVAKGVGAVVPISKAFAPFTGSTSFTENLQAEGFFPRLSMALEVMKTTAFNIARESDSREAMARAIRRAGNEAVDFITNLAAELPEDVFKLEEAFAGSHEERRKQVDLSINFTAGGADSSPGARGVMPSGDEGEFASPDGVSGRGASGGSVGGGTAGGGRGDRMGGVMVKRDELEGLLAFAKKKGLDLAEGETTDAFLARVARVKQEGEPAGATTDSGSSASADRTGGEEDAERKARAGVPSDFADVVKGAVEAAVKPIGDRLDVVEAGLADAKKKAESAEAAVNGTVVTSDAGDGDAPSARATGGDIPLMDTALDRFDEDEKEERRTH